MITYYISDQMRGKDGWNHDSFMGIEKALVHRHEVNGIPPEGVEIINPARNFNGETGRPRHEYMQLDLTNVLRSDIIVLGPDWEKSSGALLEATVGVETGKQFMLAKRINGDDWWFTNIDKPVVKPSPRAGILEEAKSLITGDRNSQYGPPTQDFRRSAEAQTAYGYRHTNLPSGAPTCPACGARPVKPHDIAIEVITIKLSRLMWSPDKRDHWVDVAGYAGCGHECVVEGT